MKKLLATLLDADFWFRLLLLCTFLAIIVALLPWVFVEALLERKPEPCRPLPGPWPPR